MNFVGRAEKPEIKKTKISLMSFAFGSVGNCKFWSTFIALQLDVEKVRQKLFFNAF